MLDRPSKRMIDYSRIVPQSWLRDRPIGVRWRLAATNLTGDAPANAALGLHELDLLTRSSSS